MDEMVQSQSRCSKRYSKLKTHPTTAKKYVSSGASKLATVGEPGLKVASLEMNIFAIVNKVKTFQEAMRSLGELCDHYEKEIPLYEYALNSIPTDDEVALQAFADFFEVDISEQSTRDSLHIGYNGTVQEYETLITGLLGKEDDLTIPDVDESDGMEGAYRAMLETFKETQLVDSVLPTPYGLPA